MSDPDDASPERSFAKGDHCLLIDNKDRQYLITLEAGSSFHYHNGELAHDVIIGAPDGSVLRSSRGGKLVALKPRMADYTLKMRRGAQVVYPKDLGAVLVWGDIGQGMTVVEAGTGSGALTMGLLRAVGPEGRVITVERREDHAAHARETLEAYFGSLPSNLTMVTGEVEDALAGTAPDRLVLDLPEPFGVVPAAVEHLPTGSIWVSYVPTVPQVQQTAEALSQSGVFFAVTHLEVLQRGWKVEGRSVRPNHQMVGHTGFLTIARKVMPLRGEG